MLDNLLIRGGQTAAHEYRMSVQVLKILLWIITMIVAVTMALVLAWDASWHDLYQWLIRRWASVLFGLQGKYNEEITIYDYNWRPYVSWVGYVLDSAGMAATERRVNNLVISGLWLGLK